MAESLYIGLMTGTSMDAVDAALVSFASQRVQILATLEYPFPAKLHQQLTRLIAAPEHFVLDQMGELDRKLGQLYAEAVNALLQQTQTPAGAITAIGSHGQTVRHRPDASPPFSLQLGDAATIATTCGITTVSSFRQADIALGGQGAPLAPAFHAWAFSSEDRARVIVNLGGIANITLLQPGQAVIGFDTGPGNTLLDIWIREHRNQPYDANGDWAAGAAADKALLSQMLQDPYFARSAPKSTGREYFNRDWLRQFAAISELDPQQVQATLAELTAASVTQSIQSLAPGTDVAVCGGGALNSDLRNRIQRRLPNARVTTTAHFGVEPQWVEAVAFAWLARTRLAGQAGNLPSVTGASRSAPLGCVHCPPET